MTEAKAFLEGFEILQGMQIYGKDKACLVSTVEGMPCLNCYGMLCFRNQEQVLLVKKMKYFELNNEQ